MKQFCVLVPVTCAFQRSWLT